MNIASVLDVAASCRPYRGNCCLMTNLLTLAAGPEASLKIGTHGADEYAVAE